MRFISTIRVVREMGLRWVFFRSLYLIYQKTHLQRLVFPTTKSFTDWMNTRENLSKDNLLEIRQNLNKMKADTIKIHQFYQDYENVRAEIIQKFNRIKSGNFIFFSGKEYSMGFPPDWFLNPLTQKSVNNQLHWSQIGDFSSGAGDIKFVWELSRFGFVYDLVRYYVSSGDETAVEIFWKLVNDWIEKNPPERGPHWKCGQEIAIRSISWLFGLIYFIQSKKTSDEDLKRIVAVLSFQARHIEKNFWYAHNCVRNNHTISESAGLFTVGMLLPILYNSYRWIKKGWKYLELEAIRQIYPDGSFLQHSHNYHRLVLQIYTWCGSIGNQNGLFFSSAVEDRLRKSAEFLYQLQDEKSGKLPNYGANDGTLFQNLSNCDYSDYRPQIQTAAELFMKKRLYPFGIWDENSLWYSHTGEIQPITLEEGVRCCTEFPDGGYYIIRDKSTKSHSVIRCHTYINRPVQADMLHMDLWVDGFNILCDSGTYSYNTDFFQNSYFVTTKAHNTIEIDGKDQMERLSQFLWTRWTKASLKHFSYIENKIVFEGECFDQSKNVHRRVVFFSDGIWTIIDEIVGSFQTAAIYWNLGIDDVEITNRNVKFSRNDLIVNIKTDYDMKIEDGYVSEYYGTMRRIPKICGKMESNNGICRFMTLIGINRPVDKEMFNSEKFKKE